MSVFSGVMAILSPNFVTRFLKESGRDVLSKLQAEYGVNCMRTSEDVCTVQGEWEAMLKVHSFLKEAENSTPVAGKGKPSGPLTCSSEQRNGGLTSSLNSEDHASDLQIMTAWGASQEEPSTYSLSNGPEAMGTVIQLVPRPGTASRSLLSNMPKLTYKGQAPPPPPPLQPINRDSSSFPDHETDIKPSILVNEHFMTNLTPPKKKRSPKAIAKKSTAKKAGTAAKDLKKKLEEKTAAAEALAASLTAVSSDLMPRIKTEPADGDYPGEKNDECLSNISSTDLLDDMPVLTKQIDGSSVLSLTPTKQEGGLDCLKCKKVFSEHKELEVHMYVYHNPDCIGKEIQCPYCSKIFLSKNGLEEHMYNHVGTRPFSCHLCPVSFNHRKSLRRHLERHSNTRKFSCDQCSLSFMRKEALDAHRLIHQRDPLNANTKLACNICEEKFDNMASYRKHMQYDHYELNETLNLGPTTHLEEVEGIEDDEDVVDLFKDDDGDWRKPKRKGKSKAVKGKGNKRKAGTVGGASPRKKKAAAAVSAEPDNGDTTADQSGLLDTDHSALLDADHSGLLDHSGETDSSRLDASEVDSSKLDASEADSSKLDGNEEKGKKGDDADKVADNNVVHNDHDSDDKADHSSDSNDSSDDVSSSNSDSE